MVKFAKDCRQATARITNELEIELGPGTSDLQMRFGLHSVSHRHFVFTFFVPFNGNLDAQAMPENSLFNRDLLLLGFCVESVPDFNCKLSSFYGVQKTIPRDTLLLLYSLVSHVFNIFI